MKHDITITDQTVTVRSGDATVTVYLDPNSKNMVAVNRDSGGPSETITRRPRANDRDMLDHLFAASQGHGVAHSDSPVAQRARREGWTRVNPDWSGMTEITDAGRQYYAQLDADIMEAR